jgi:hypothetical protein
LPYCAPVCELRGVMDWFITKNNQPTIFIASMSIKTNANFWQVE